MLSPGHRPSRTLFIVDDSTAEISLYRQILEGENYSIEGCTNPDQALRELSQREPPDLILVDCMMSEMSGEEFLKELRTSLPRLARESWIVCYSNSPRDFDEVGRTVKLANGFFEKPSSLEDIVTSINRQWELSPRANGLT